MESESSASRADSGVVTAVSASPEHGPLKTPQPSIEMIPGRGIVGDVHLGERVQHRSRAARDPDLPNLRQVHLIHSELHEELLAAGFALSPGQMGENVTTRGVDLLSLPLGTKLQLGASAVVEVTGLRNPCAQLDRIHPGLMAATLDRDESGALVRKAGIMAIVLAGGRVSPGDVVRVEEPLGETCPLEPV